MLPDTDGVALCDADRVTLGVPEIDAVEVMDGLGEDERL